MKETAKIIGKKVTDLAFKTSVKTANSACAIWFNQPKEPEALRKFKKH